MFVLSFIHSQINQNIFVQLYYVVGVLLHAEDESKNTVFAIKELWFIVKIRNNCNVVIIALIHPINKYVLGPYSGPCTVLGIGMRWVRSLSLCSPVDLISYQLCPVPSAVATLDLLAVPQTCHTCSHLPGFELHSLCLDALFPSNCMTPPLHKSFRIVI